MRSLTMMIVAAAVAVAAPLGAPSDAAARPLTPAEQRYMPYTAWLPLCGDPATLERISTRFQQRETEFWGSGLLIVGYERVRETGERTTGLDYIPRRYCQARAMFNDGKKREVTYWIGEGIGMAGHNFGVEWCVSGLDRHNAHAPNCKAARP
jgi:hypothetical protein